MEEEKRREKGDRGTTTRGKRMHKHPAERTQEAGATVSALASLCSFLLFLQFCARSKEGATRPGQAARARAARELQEGKERSSIFFLGNSLQLPSATGGRSIQKHGVASRRQMSKYDGRYDPSSKLRTKPRRKLGKSPEDPGRIRAMTDTTEDAILLQSTTSYRLQTTNGTTHEGGEKVLASYASYVCQYQLNSRYERENGNVKKEKKGGLKGG